MQQIERCSSYDGKTRKVCEMNGMNADVTSSINATRVISINMTLMLKQLLKLATHNNLYFSLLNCC